MNDKIICFGKNYRDHMHELGDQSVDTPVIFLKPFSVLRQSQKWDEKLTLSLPADEVHYECELGFKLISPDEIGFVSVGLDLTKRVLQKKLKEAGHPWTIGKVFHDSAVVGPWVKIDSLKEILQLPFSFYINEELRQNSAGNKMIFSPTKLVKMASDYFPLCTGDIIFTGTPAGVGKINAGDIGVVRLGLQEYQVQW